MKNRTPSFIVCLFRKKERKEQKQKGKKNKMMIKIADVKSHFSKGVSFREFGTKFWQRLNSKFSIFTKKKKKKVSSVAGTGTFSSPFMTSAVQPASLNDETQTI